MKLTWRAAYAVFAAAVCAALSWALWTGWWTMPVDKIADVPKSVRDNPGSYRSHYASYSHRYYGGK
jgi:hypothetical protein